MKNKFQIFGLIYAAKKLVLGQEGVIHRVRSGKVDLVVISATASDNTRKIVTDKCKSYDVDYVILDDDGQISRALGKESVKVVGILTKGFSKKIKELAEETNGEN